MNYKTFSLLVLLIARTFLLSSFIITTANFILPENIYACDSIHNNGEPPPCDDDDECCDSSSGSTGCANCEGTPEPILYPSGKLEMLDKPMYYKSAIGPDFDVFLKYTPQLHHVVKNDVGHNWSMLYRSFDLEEKNPTNFWFFYSNGLAHHFEKLDGNWKETDAFGSMQKGTLGLPKHGRSFWISDDRITAVISTENENHYGFELVGETYRLAWAADKFGDKMSFHYSTNLPGIFDYVLTADNKKFNFNYHFGITNYPDNLKNGKIESIEGPFTAADIEIPNITRKILFTYEIRYEIYKTDDKYYILLDSVTDMANRTFEYDYALANQNLVTSMNWNVSLSEVKGPQGHTTSIKYQQNPFKITVFYPDSSWETVSFNGIANFYYADYWNSQQGSALNPVSSKKFTYSYNGWMLDEYEGKVDSLGRRTTNKKLNFSGVGDVFTTNRPYLAWKTFEKTISDKNNKILEETYFQYYKNPAETGLLQNQLTDLYQKWGYPYKITKFDANGNTTEVTIYEDLSVDINGALLGRTIITKDGNGNILSESKEFSKQQNWRAETIADWPSGFPFSFTILLTNSGQKTSEIDWAEKRYFYNASGKILSEKIRIDNTGNDSLDFIISKFYTYYAEGTGNNRLSATYFPAENPIIESNITGDLQNFTGLKKIEFVYDEAGRIITENIYFFKEHSSPPFQSVDYQYDSLDRKILAKYSDGDIELWSYSASCCGIATYRNRDGITTLYGRDLRARPTRETVFSPRATILSDTSYKLDFNGNVIKKTDARGGISTYKYDEADRLISQTDTMGGKTLYGYDLFDKRIFTVFPNGLTERIFYDENNNPLHKANYASLANAATNSLSITNSLPLTANDGQPFIESYNFSVDGYLEMKFGPYKHSSVSPFSYNTNNFSEKYSYDLSGRKLKTVTDDGAAGFYSRNEYEPRGLLTKSVGPVVVGAAETAADINKQNFYNSAGLLKFSVSAPYIETDNPADKKRRVTKYNYDFRFNKISETKIGTMDAAVPVTLANLDSVTFTTVAFSDFDSKGRVITNYQEGITAKYSYTEEDNYELTTQTFPDGSTSKTFFDGNRISKIIDRNGIIKRFEYDAAGNRIKEMKNEKLIMKNCFDLLGRLTSVSNALNEATFYNYDSMGNQTKIIFPDGQFQTRQYNLLNQLVSVDGANTYPLKFDYNALGRKIQMIDGNGSKTKWAFDILSRLKYKCYDGHTTNFPDFEYFYDISSRLISRKDKKNILTKYWYDNIGRMRGVDYPDPTQKSNLSDFLSTSREGMDIRYTFDFLGRRTKMEDATGTNSYSYETVSSRINFENGPNAKIQRTYDSSGNIDKLFIGETETTADYLTDYNYTAGTLNSIQSSVFRPPSSVFSLPSSVFSLPSSVSSNQYFYNNSGRKIKLESFAWETDHWKLATIQNWTYDNADRILSVTNLSVNSATSVASFFNYSLDKQGRRTNCFKNSPFSKGGEGDLISYEYNPRSELISADLSSDLCPLSSEFSYDPIGNRLLERQNDLLIQGDYNSWNQLTNRFFHGDIGYFGTATTTNSRNLTYLFVDGTNLISSTTNKHEFARIKKLRGTNVSVLIVAANNANKTNSASLNFDPNQNLLYDANGNLTNDGEHSYSYNMENRLTKCSTSVSLVNYSYDGLGRKVKSKEINLTTGKTNETKFIYNNWNVIQEITTSQLHSLTSSYFWGNDLSGSLHGAGGIGGLIANSPFSKGGAGGFYFYNYDANGNVINLIDNQGETAAHYEYSPFGKTISQTGYYAATNKFRFSTKRFEEIGELYYYGYRYYKPPTGNWLTRDPIAENGGENLYVFVQNGPINHIDFLGLSIGTWDFVAWYFVGNGRTIDLAEIGMLGGIIDTAAEVTEIWEIEAKKKSIEKAKKLLQSKRKTGKKYKKHSIGIDLGGVAWSLGDTSLLRIYMCRIKVKCKNDRKSYKYKCKIKYKIAEWFRDPYDIGVEDPSGTPYRIKANWGKTLEGKGIL